MAPEKKKKTLKIYLSGPIAEEKMFKFLGFGGILEFSAVRQKILNRFLLIVVN